MASIFANGWAAADFGLSPDGGRRILGPGDWFGWGAPRPLDSSLARTVHCQLPTRGLSALGRTMTVGRRLGCGP